MGFLHKLQNNMVVGILHLYTVSCIPTPKSFYAMTYYRNHTKPKYTWHPSSPTSNNFTKNAYATQCYFLVKSVCDKWNKKYLVSSFHYQYECNTVRTQDNTLKCMEQKNVLKNDNITICVGGINWGMGYQIRSHLKSKTYDMSHIWGMNSKAKKIRGNI